MDPAVVSDNEQYVSLMKEYKNLTPIVEKYRDRKLLERYLESVALKYDMTLAELSLLLA